jgi:hypothetical protein
MRNAKHCETAKGVYDEKVLCGVGRLGLALLEFPPAVSRQGTGAWLCRYLYPIRNAQGIEAEFGRKAAKLERIARFLRSKNAPDFQCLI